jgi:type VI protein secretion system component VasF
MSNLSQNQKIILIVVVVLILCCCCSLIALYGFGSTLEPMMSEIFSELEAQQP